MKNVPESILQAHPDAQEVFMPKIGCTSIDVLLDPRTHKVCYVGKAQNPGTRLAVHLSFPRVDEPYPKQKWLRALVAEGLQPRMFVIETVPVALGVVRERHWVMFYRAQGEADCNRQAILSEEQYEKNQQSYRDLKNRRAEKIKHFRNEQSRNEQTL